MMGLVSWDDDIPNICKHKIHVPNHQPVQGRKKTWNHQPTWRVNTAINLPRVVESNITKCKKHHQTWEYTDIYCTNKKRDMSKTIGVVLQQTERGQY